MLLRSLLKIERVCKVEAVRVFPFPVYIIGNLCLCSYDTHDLILKQSITGELYPWAPADCWLTAQMCDLLPFVLVFLNFNLSPLGSSATFQLCSPSWIINDGHGGLNFCPAVSLKSRTEAASLLCHVVCYSVCTKQTQPLSPGSLERRAGNLVL